MRGIAPHEPEEELLSVEDAFEDAAGSEARWQALAGERAVRQLCIELPGPVYETLERLAERQHQPVPAFVEHVIEDLLATFAPTG